MNKVKIAVLISGRGSNLQALIDACNDSNFPAEIVVVLSNKQDAYGLERAKKANISTEFISHKNYSNREEFDKKMDQVITQYNASIICMAGFMRLLSEWFTKKWENRLINIHPSLLPNFKGLNAQQQALDAKVKEAGCTVHFVTKEMDAGPIIIQKKVKVLPDDNLTSLSSRILKQEHIAYVEALEKVAKQYLNCENK